ncbi:hypothetical protein D3C76_1347940 [compost metagenome]
MKFRSKFIFRTKSMANASRQFPLARSFPPAIYTSTFSRMRSSSAIIMELVTTVKGMFRGRCFSIRNPTEALVKKMIWFGWMKVQARLAMVS